MIGYTKMEKIHSLPQEYQTKQGRQTCRALIVCPEVDAIIELLHGIWVALRVESVQSAQGESAHTVKGWMGVCQTNKGVLGSWCV